MNTWTILRRIFWMLYACPLVLLVFACDAVAIWQYGPRVVPWAALDFLISAPGLVALFLHIWDTRLFVPLVWKIYAFLLIAWDLFFNLLIEPAITGEALEPLALAGFILFVPLYVAVFRYAFRNWGNMAD